MKKQVIKFQSRIRTKFLSLTKESMFTQCEIYLWTRTNSSSLILLKLRWLVASPCIYETWFLVMKKKSHQQVIKRYIFEEDLASVNRVDIIRWTAKLWCAHFLLNFQGGSLHQSQSLHCCTLIENQWHRMDSRNYQSGHRQDPSQNHAGCQMLSAERKRSCRIRCQGKNA